MLVKSIFLSRQEWRENRLSGTVTFSGDFGEVKLNVSDEAAEKILALCAEGLVQAAQQTSKLMLSDVINALPAPKV
jgi:hypothetical protein